MDTEVRGLSQDEIHDLRTGAGMGLALPAELNGWPGPLHVLELEKELELTEMQKEEVQRLREEMLVQAIPLGEQIIGAHAAMESAFREGQIDATSLLEHLEVLEGLYRELRYVHLNTHLETYPVLTEHQRILYDEHRGYASGGGHDHGHDHGTGH